MDKSLYSARTLGLIYLTVSVVLTIENWEILPVELEKCTFSSGEWIYLYHGYVNK